MASIYRWMVPVIYRWMPPWMAIDGVGADDHEIPAGQMVFGRGGWISLVYVAIYYGSRGYLAIPRIFKAIPWVFCDTNCDEWISIVFTMATVMNLALAAVAIAADSQIKCGMGDVLNERKDWIDIDGGGGDEHQFPAVNLVARIVLDGEAI